MISFAGHSDNSCCPLSSAIAPILACGKIFLYVIQAGQVVLHIAYTSALEYNTSNYGYTANYCLLALSLLVVLLLVASHIRK